MKCERVAKSARCSRDILQRYGSRGETGERGEGEKEGSGRDDSGKDRTDAWRAKRDHLELQGGGAGLTLRMSPSPRRAPLHFTLRANQPGLVDNSRMQREQPSRMGSVTADLSITRGTVTCSGGG